jgi:hypothetical protein
MFVMRVNRKYALLLAVALVSLVCWYFWGFSRTPDGQPQLTSLTPSNLDQFKQPFNDATDRTRLVLLLSPT